MAKINWDISGEGGQAIIEEAGSKRCQLSGKKLMLWNGKSDLVNCELITDIRLFGTAGYCRGGVMLRSDGSELNGYACTRVYKSGANSEYLIYKVVGGVWTQIAQADSNFGWTEWARTRIRIDGWQISVDEWFGGDWFQAVLIEETIHQHASGYIGLIGTSTNIVGSILFDNVEISERS